MIDEGAGEVKIHGEYFKVKANIEHIHTMSSHADQGELLEWVSEIKHPPKKVFIIHGEPQASQALRVKMKDKYGWPCYAPRLLDKIELET
jgi:metallo-beta-lactamase family protein